MSRHQTATAAVMAAAGLAIALLAEPAPGQPANLAASASHTADAGSRDAEYAALADDVDALQRELSIVKRVVKLVTPTVVHIEAKPLPRYRGLLNGDDIPRKRGPGIVRSDLLVINKTDLAPLVGADLERMMREALEVRNGKPVLTTNCATGEGIGALVERLSHDVLFDR